MGAVAEAPGVWDSSIHYFGLVSGVLAPRADYNEALRRRIMV